MDVNERWAEGKNEISHEGPRKNLLFEECYYIVQKWKETCMMLKRGPMYIPPSTPNIPPVANWLL